MMLAEGFGGGDRQAARWRSSARVVLRAARLVAAVRLHALGAKLDDVTKVFTDEAGLDDTSARREAERAAIDPMVMVDALGRIAIEAARRLARRTQAPTARRVPRRAAVARLAAGARALPKQCCLWEDN